MQQRGMEPPTNGTTQPARRPSPLGKALRGRWRAATCVILAIGSFVLAGPARAQPACKPLLSVQTVREALASAIPSRERTWQATLATDIRYCATRNGIFEIDFIRTKDNAPDLQFTEKFRWRERKFSVSIELAADESIEGFRIGFIAPCVCRAYANGPTGP